MAYRQKPADKLRFFSDASVAIDGSKFKAVNNRDKNFTDRKLQARLEQLEQSIARYMDELDELIVSQHTARSRPDRAANIQSARTISRKETYMMMDEDDSLPQEAKALRDSIVMIRTAQGKSVPSEFPFGSPGWHAVALQFAQDIDRLWSSEE